MGLSFARVYSRPSLFSSLLVQVQAQVQVQYSEPSQYRQHICLHHGTVPPLVFLMRPPDEHTNQICPRGESYECCESLRADGSFTVLVVFTYVGRWVFQQAQRARVLVVAAMEPGISLCS